MEIVIVVAAKVAEYTVAPIGRYIVWPLVRPIARPFINLWEYDINLKNLKEEMKKLEAKREWVQGLTNVGVEPPLAVQAWQGKVTNFINEVSGLTGEDNPEQESRKCCEGCTYSNLKECYQRRNTVARKLTDVARLLEEAENSAGSWESQSKLENLKKEVEELVEKLKEEEKKLVARKESVQRLIKDGEEPLQHVKLWQDKVNEIIDEISGLINPQQQNMQRCSDLNIWYQQRKDNVARMSEGVAQLLHEAGEVEKLKDDVEKLKAKRDTVKCSIKGGKQPLPDVKLWLDKVDNIINEVSGRVNSQQQNNVARTSDDVAQLLKEGNEFKKFSFLSSQVEPWLQSSKGYIAFESRTSILKEIIEALSKPDVGLVGIYGMGGIGKTTLAKQVARQAYQDKLFNKIVFVEVSQTPDIKKVQGEIGSKLGLEFREEDDSSERARQLYQQLKDEEKTLLILDNIWESLDFETIGIPYKHDSKGLKLLMTARKSNVLTDGMEYSQHNFSIEALKWEDAWSLFKSKAGSCVDRPDLHRIAVDVAKECGGVPIAIVTIAKTLNNKETYEWRKVLRELGNPSSDSFGGIAANVYRSIELSYNYLETEELKATFLLCSSMGRTYDVTIEDLLRYGIGLGLFNRFNTIEEERDNVCSLVSTLKASSLLVDAPKRDIFFRNQLSDIERFAMHDVVCNVARLIAYKYKNVYSVIDHVPRSWKSENKLKNYTFITLHDVNEFSEDLQLECPQLSFLYVKPKLSDGKSHSRISDKFFARMPKLQVVHLIGIDLQTLSTPFSDLVNLRTLCLEQCILKRIVDVGDLENLEILSFRGCRLPKEAYRFHGYRSCPVFKLSEKMRQLSKLRLLEFNCGGHLQGIPLEFILSFKKLEALYMGHTTITWEAEKSNSGSRNASLDVLEHLSNLTSLEIRVRDATMLRGLLSPKLERYNIEVGSFPYPRGGLIAWLIRCETSRFLQVKLNTNEDGIISRLKPIKQLVLDEVPNIANNFCDLDNMGFPELEDLKVEKNSHILHIVDTVSCDGVLPVLKSLILSNLINLKTICNGPLGMKLFHQLRTIRVSNCPELTNFFSFSSDRVFQELEEIEVWHCEKMKEIFAISERVHEIKFSKLRILGLTSLPQLESLCCNVKTTTPVLQFTSDTKPKEIILDEERDVSKPLFNEKVVVTKLEILTIDNINIKSIWDSQLPTMANIPNLTCLNISNLASLTSLGSGDYIKFPLLKEMRIESCPKFKEFFFDDKVGVPSLEKIDIYEMDNLKMIWHNQLVEDFFPKLKWLRVWKCNNLRRLGSGDYIKFPLLNKMIIMSCPKFKEYFFDDKVGFPSLEEIYFSRMDNLKMIWHNQLVEDSFPKLKSLGVSECNNLTRLGSGDYIKFPLLKEMRIESCPKFKEVFLDDKVGVPSLKEIKISNMENLKMIWHNQLFEDSFLQLKSLQVEKCHKLLTLFHSNMCGRFLSLETLNVSECSSLKEILDLQGINSKESHSTTSTQNRELCTYSPLVLSFANLQNLKVSNCESLKTIVAKEEVEAKEVPETARFVFPKLTSLELCKLPELKTFYPDKYTTEWPVLKTFKMHQCKIHDTNKMRERQQLPLLPNEVAFEFQVGEIWPNLLLTMSSWVQNLTILTLHGCDNLEELFPYSMVVTEELSEKKMGNPIVFPKLNYLEMKQLANLKRLCFGCHIEFPTLKKFEISDCSELTAFIFDDKIKVPSLTKLKISSMDNLKMIWDNQLTENSSSKLKSLQVQGCYKVLTWLQWNMCESFSSLETLDVSDCGSLEEIFDLQVMNSEERHITTSTQSQELYTTILSFANLQNLKVSKCRSLKSLFSVSNVAKDRGEAEEMHATARFVFPNLTSLELYKLPELRTFYPARYTVEWPVLRRLRQCDCDISNTDKNIVMQQQSFPHRYGFSSSRSMHDLEIHVERIWLSWLLPMVSSSFQNLTWLVVYGCGNLKELFPSSNLVKEELKEKEMGNTILFPKLECLEMEYLADLTRLCSGYYIEFPSLKNYKISNCPRLKAFIFDHKVKVPNLKNMKISSMNNLKIIWDDQLTENSIPKLESLQVMGCQKLLTLFQSNVYGRFLSLETLDVSDCGSLEKIFDLHEINSEERHSTTSIQSKELYTTVLSFGNLRDLEVSECESLRSVFSISNVAKENVAAKEAHATTKFIFPKLTYLKLYKLPELRTFCPGRYTMEWPISKRLQLWDTDDEDQMVFPCLILSGSELMMMWQGQDPEPLFRNFKILEVLDESKAKDLLYESQPVLHYIGDVKSMWNCKLDSILRNFEKIVVGRCDSFISLMPPSASFGNLTSLEVNDCNSLEDIGTFSMAKNLVKLVSLRICRCEKIVEVLRNHEDVTGDKILFGNLKHLSLIDLLSLTSFCPWNFTLEFPSLEELEVSGCPNMKIFCQGVLTTRKLREVKCGWPSIKLCPDVDVNTAIQQFHEQEQVAKGFSSDFSIYGSK